MILLEKVVRLLVDKECKIFLYYYSLLFQQGIPLQPNAAFQGALHITDSHKRIHVDIHNIWLYKIVLAGRKPVVCGLQIRGLLERSGMCAPLISASSGFQAIRQSALSAPQSSLALQSQPCIGTTRGRVLCNTRSIFDRAKHHMYTFVCFACLEFKSVHFVVH